MEVSVKRELTVVPLEQNRPGTYLHTYFSELNDVN